MNCMVSGSQAKSGIVVKPVTRKPIGSEFEQNIYGMTWDMFRSCAHLSILHFHTKFYEKLYVRSNVHGAF